MKCDNCGKEAECEEYREQFYCPRCVSQIRHYEEAMEHERKAQEIMYESVKRDD